MVHNPACIQVHNYLKHTKQMHQAYFLSHPKILHLVHHYYLLAQLITKQNANHQPFPSQYLQAEDLKKAKALPKNGRKEIFQYHHNISDTGNNAKKSSHFVIF